MTKTLLTSACWLLAVLLGAPIAARAITPAERELVKARHAEGRASGRELRWLWQPAMDPDTTAAALFLVPASSRNPLLDATVPVRVPGTTLLEIDLTALGWREVDWHELCGFPANDYTPHANPLVVPAGWFVAQVADGRQSEAYLRFVFGGQPPASEDAFLAAFGIDRKQQGGLQFGLVEGASGVNLTPDGARLVEHNDGLNAEAWVTYDVRRVQAGSDPLVGLFAGKFAHDASEVFVLSVKVRSDGRRGVMPFTMLANGAGELQAEAPSDIVRDRTDTFGDGVIVNPGSCISCHTAGPQRPTKNAFRERLASGVEVRARTAAEQQAVDLFHLGDVATALDRWEEDFAVTVAAINGLTPLENAVALRGALRHYREDVTLERAAAELETSGEELQLALGWAGAQGIDLGPRAAGLAEGLSMPRSAFEAEYLKLRHYLDDWRRSR